MAVSLVVEAIGMVAYTLEAGEFDIDISSVTYLACEKNLKYVAKTLSVLLVMTASLI